MRLLASHGNYDFIITEIGGTVGDIESLPYIEAVRQLRWELGNNAAVIHLTLVPYLAASGELKTKPTQHSVKTLLELGVQPDIIVCRSEKHINESLRNKIALFCNVQPDAVVESVDVETIYEVPIKMREQNLDTVVLRKLDISNSPDSDLSNWEDFLFRLKNPINEVNIALVGKYVELKDAYKSILESFVHAGTANQHKVNVKLVHSEFLTEDNIVSQLSDVSGILIAPGFGERGVEGKILATRFARENKIPFLGICLGMQVAVIEFARNVLNLENAHSREIDRRTQHPVIDIMESQKKASGKGGTMRLGLYPCKIKQGSKASEIFKTEVINERHRHRYEFNNKYIEMYSMAGMLATGINPNEELVEIVELNDHPWFIGVQFHPEYRSTIESPHPLFVAFVEAAIKHNSGK